MNAHTPGPYTQGYNDGVADGKMYARSANVAFPPVDNATFEKQVARRIVAEQQRDALAEALRELLDVLTDGEWGTHAHGQAGDKARAALAKAGL